MPHLQLDLCPNLMTDDEITSILGDLVQTFEECPTVSSSAIKAYSRICSSYVMGTGAPSAFVHLTVCLMTGRLPEDLNTIRTKMYERLVESISRFRPKKSISITLEIRQMDSEYYMKS